MSESHEETESWKLGIKLEFLISWSRQQRFSPSLTTREICQRYIMPSTQATQLSYCEQLLLSEDTAEFVGSPSAFVSHAWDYHFLEVLEALTSYFADEEDVIIWFDIFSNNQHITTSLDFEWWCSTFKNAILSFGRTVMVLAPWNDPLPLQRGWCIWELYCTIEGKSDGKCKFDVAMSPASIEQFIADVEADPVNVMNTMLATIDVSKSKCFKAEDRERIHDAIRRTLGFNELNKEIFGVMREWVISKYENKYKSLEDDFDFDNLTIRNNLADLYLNQGDYGKALPLFEESLRNLESIEESPDRLIVKNSLAMLYLKQGEYEKALPLFEECLSIMKVVFGDSHPNTLRCMNNLAILHMNQQEYGRAFALYEECLSIMKVTLGANHPDALFVFNNLAILYLKQGDYGKALPLNEECLRMMRVTLGDNHPDTLSCMTNLALLYMNQKEVEKAFSLNDECLRIMNPVLGYNHPDTITCMANLVMQRVKQGEGGKYLRFLKALFGAKHPVIISITNLYEISRYEKALPLNRSLRLRKVLRESRPDILGSALPLYKESLRLSKVSEESYVHLLRTNLSQTARHCDDLQK